MKTNTVQLASFAEELSIELQQIHNYYASSQLVKFGGTHERADKCIITYAGILWSFSAAFNAKLITNLDTAERTYHYIINHFIDIDFGGVFWSIDYHGNPKQTKKQIDVIAFTINAFSEYFMACGDELVKEHAIVLYKDLVKHSHHLEKGSYEEAFNREWEEVVDPSFYNIDIDREKSLNTPLYVLEGLSNLYNIWPDIHLKALILKFLNDFTAPMLKATHMPLVANGYDIKASWLLCKTAMVVEAADLMASMKTLSVKMAEATLSGLDDDEQLWSAFEHCWVQAQALVSFFNAWQINADRRFLHAAMKCWAEVKSNMLHKVHKECCAYHNFNAGIELLRRIS